VKHAGFGFPTGPEPERIWTMPATIVLMLDPEARFHYNTWRRRSDSETVLWRPIGRPPATLDFNVQHYVDSLALLWSEQEHGGTEHFIVGNEFNLNYERGDDEDDWNPDVMASVYQRFGSFLSDCLVELRGRGLGDIRFHFPAWSPGHFLRENADAWVPTAEQYDVVDFHAYGDVEALKSEYDWYRTVFPGKMLCLTEWHGGRQEGPPEEGDNDRVRQDMKWLAAVVRDDPNFLGATYFIWKWHRPSGESFRWDIEGNEAYQELFSAPPSAE
jgi:hypothetical protein